MTAARPKGTHACSAALLVTLMTLVAGAACLLAGAAPALARSGDVLSWNIVHGPGDDGYARIAQGPGGVYAAGTTQQASFDVLVGRYSPANKSLGRLMWDNAALGGDEIVAALAVDAAGNAVVAGLSEMPGSPICDVMVLKVSPKMDVVWARVLDGGFLRGDRAEDVACDAAGNVYVTGLRSTETGSDFWTMKLAAATGALLWQAFYDGGSWEVARALCLDTQGNVYVTGQSANAAADQPARGACDAATVKYDRNGVQKWVVRSDGPRHVHDEAFKIALGTSGALFVADTNSASQGGEDDLWLIRLSTSGRETWQRTLDSRSHWSDFPWALQVGKRNSAYVAGTATSADSTRSRGLVARWDSAGGLRWTREKTPAGGREAAFRDLVIDGAGDAWCAGWTTSRRQGNDADGLVCHYDASGRRLWATTWDGPGHGDDVFCGLTLRGSKALFAAGETDTPGFAQDAATVKLTR